MRAVEAFLLRHGLSIASEAGMALVGTSWGWWFSLLVDRLQARLDRVREAG